MKKAKDLRDMSVEELEALVLEVSNELFHVTNEQKHAKKLEKPHRLRTLRRDKARILTTITQKTAAANK